MLYGLLRESGVRNMARTNWNEEFDKEHKEIIRTIEGQKDAEGKTKHLGLIEQIEQGGRTPL